jgi:hypothetical protein
MAALLEQLLVARFVERDDDTVKIFDVLPARSVVDDLRRFTKETGTPDLWRWHLHTRPPKGSRFKIVADDITVPESLRPRIGLAPCPICSLHAPKFFSGMLVWFPDERSLRVIGGECAKHVSGEQALTDARQDFKVRKADDAATNFLFENLPLVREAKPAFAEVYRRARQLDKTARAIRSSLRQDARKSLLDAATAAGGLGLYEWVQVPMLDRQGRPILDDAGEIRRTEGRALAGVIQVEGLPIFGTPQNCESYAVRAAAALDGLFVNDDDELLDLLSRLDDLGRVEAAKHIRDAWILMGKACSLFSRMQRFLEPDNIERLGEWGRDPRAPARLYAAARASGRIELGEIGRKAVAILPNRAISDPVPTYPDLAVIP